MNERPKIVCQLDNEACFQAMPSAINQGLIYIEAADSSIEQVITVYATKEAFRKWAEDVLAMMKEPKP